ncbi:hypothetical protein GCE9029_01180 [Grimontia celer]|uniref:Uncharacterized protein n=1 Tax=Grimontia celer TaxID=1796497 RepID=A0A128EXV2_9GAMM|nr:hypothetical protein [Grimontia celer]CZF78984.1 hypothetical protein GCE9029_01180 [Grimontia celer]
MLTKEERKIYNKLIKDTFNTDAFDKALCEQAAKIMAMNEEFESTIATQGVMLSVIGDKGQQRTIANPLIKTLAQNNATLRAVMVNLATRQDNKRTTYLKMAMKRAELGLD